MKLSNIKYLALAIVLLSTSISLKAGKTASKQAVTIESKNLNSLLNKADLAYKSLKYSIAADYYNAYIENNKNASIDVYNNLSDCYWQMRKYDKSLAIYKQMFPDGNENASNTQKIRFAELNARFGDYLQASKILNGVDGYKLKASTYSDNIKMDNMKKDSSNYKIQLLNINTSNREFSPFLSNNTLFYSSNKPLLGKHKGFDWDGNNYSRLWKIPVSNLSFISKLDDSQSNNSVSRLNKKKLAGIYEDGDNKPSSKATKTVLNKTYTSENLVAKGSLVTGLDKILYNTGEISVDNHNHVYFSANYSKLDKSGRSRICLMEGVYSSASGISNIKTLPFGDPNLYSVMHPAINPDGTILVFSSDKPDGKGGYDLYYAKRENVNQTWGESKILSDNVNTAGNEVFSSITPKGDLFFSSDMLPGLGGLDIFKISLLDALSGKGEPEHLSYPLNSSSDDFGMTQDSTGLKGFFTSDRLDNNDNIYSFNYEQTKMAGKNFIQGKLLDENTKEPIKNVTVFLLNKENDSVLVAKTDTNGIYNFPVDRLKEVVIKAVEKDHTINCISMDVEVRPSNKDSIVAPKEIFLGKYQKDYKWELEFIHYDFDKSYIRSDAKPILDSLVRLLNKYPITVELGSHTDSRGSYAYNDALSQRRADAAVAYLVSKGIDPKRITAKGYGERQLKNKCADGVNCSEADHQINRRTEIKVTGVINTVAKPDIDPDKYSAGQKINKSDLPKDFFNKCK